MPRVFTRNLRVAAEAQRVLNELLAVAVKDPRLHGISVSAVDVSGDLGVATVFYSALDPDRELGDVDAAFAKARGFLRARLAASLDLRRAPELRFRHDVSAGRAVAIGHLIDATGAGAAPVDEPSSDPVDAADTAD